MKKAALHNLGCKVNAYETEAMQQILENAGYEIVPFTEIADVYVINTCSVTNMADRKSRQMFHRAKKMNPDAIVVGAGCYVQTKEAQALVDESIDIVIGNNQKHELVTLLNEYEKEHTKQAQIVDINHEKQEYEELHLKKTAEHTRAFIKVQDGCNQFCSYCIIPFARGRVRSRKMEDVLNEIKGLAKSGYKEVVLTGIHLSSYGVDTGETLLSLIEHVHEIEGIERIRLGSLEPLVARLDYLRMLVSAPPEPSSEGLILSTVHSSKGLEYETVYLLDVLDGILPAVTEPKGPEEERRYQEERRLFYVAMTRAKDHL